MPLKPTGTLGEILTGPETWGKGHLVRDGRMCLVGALQRLMAAEGRAIAGEAIPAKEFDRLDRIVRAVAKGYPPAPCIAPWQDEPGRTWAQVQAVVAAYDRDRALNPSGSPGSHGCTRTIDSTGPLWAKVWGAADA